ncbi:MAG TPA: NADP-dependent oxidoreductase [Acidobacteriaceae bacterium]|nr:NADP-dependent oxidoreductase [Acidobacteriaceae bacterium]
MIIKIPKFMRAAAIDRFGGPELLTLHSLPVPVPDPQEVLIRLHTAGIGGWDADMRGGWWPEGQPHFPFVPGTDGASTIASVGSRVRRLNIGDEVYAYSFNNPKGGFYAEYVVVPASYAAPIPEGLDLKRAGAIPTTGLTALQGVDNALQLKAGKTVLIHGASGGVGTLAVQFAKLRGAGVLAKASGADGLSLVRRLGADVAVEGRTGDIVAAVRLFTRNGVDAVLALAGGKQLTGCLDALRKGGRLAYPNGIEPVPRKRNGIEVLSYDAVPGVAEFRRLGNAVARARLRVPIAETFKLTEAAKAHERLVAGQVVGKIVLRIH